MTLRSIKYFIFLFLIQSFIFPETNLKELENCVHVNFSIDRDIYYPGENLYLTFEIDIDNGYHIYSVHPDKSLSPTYIEVLDTIYFSQIGIMHEPEPLQKFDKNFNQYISYHKNNFELIQDFKLSDNISFGKHSINFTLVYLACNPIMCIPKWDDFNFSFEVFEGDKRPEFDIPLVLDYNYSDNEPDTNVPNELEEQTFVGIELTP